MATPEELVALAEGEVGTVESPAGSNRTRYAAEAGHANGQPWCATFCVAMARRLGVRLGNESAYTPTLLASMPNGGDPRLGALAFFDFPDSVHRIQHVGIVRDWTSTTVTCVEGNTSPGSSGSQSNGGGVWIRTRPRSHVKGYAYPAYTATEEDDMFSDQDRAALEELRAHVVAIEARLPATETGAGYLFANGTHHWGFTTAAGNLQRWVARDTGWECDVDEPGFVPGQWAVMTALSDRSRFGTSFEVSASLTTGKVGRKVWTNSDGWRSGLDEIG